MASERDARRRACVDKTAAEVDALVARGVLAGGNAFSAVLLVKGELTQAERAGEPAFSGADGTALRASLERLGYAPEDCETYILAGLPGQDIQSVKDTINFVWDNGGVPKLAEFSPIPGTPHFEAAAEKLPALRTEPLLQNNSVYCSYFSRDITPEELQELKDMTKRRAL